MKELKRPDKWNDAISYYRKIKKIILKESDAYQNGKITSTETEGS